MINSVEQDSISSSACVSFAREDLVEGRSEPSEKFIWLQRPNLTLSLGRLV